MISIIFPLKNEEGNIEELHEKTKRAMEKTREPFEIIAVDDGSTDSSLKKLKTLSPVKIVVLAKNYGQSSALDAGIKAAEGEVIAIMDADLQTDPEDMLPMLQKLHEGYDAVVGWRKDRRDPLGRKLFSKFANWLARTVLNVTFHDFACPIKVFKKEYIEGLTLYGEMHVFLGGILIHRGARVTEVVVRHQERKHGISKHNFIKGAKDVADLFTIKFITSTSRPLVIFGSVGLASWFIAFIAGALAVFLKITHLRNLAETPLPVITSLFIILGLLLVMMGFLAEVMLRIYYEGKEESHYRIREIIEQ